jgi:hypothetical protein
VTKPNPWSDRFDVNISDVDLDARVRVNAVPILDLSKSPTGVAVRRLQMGLRAVFVPTQQIRNGLRLLLSASHAHALDRYPSAMAFLQGLYAMEPPNASRSPSATRLETLKVTSFAAWPPICLTGLAGAGKTELLHAYARCLSPESTVEIPRHGAVPLVSHWAMRITAGVTFNRLLQPFLNGDTSILIRAGSLWEAACRQSFWQGVCLVLLDELQFLSQTQTANATVARMLMQMSLLGPPLVYVANFSLLHRLLRRPQEEGQRLLTSPFLLEPDLEDSKERLICFREKLRVAPEFRGLDDSDGVQSHRYSFGLNRLEDQLLTIAYRISREAGSKVVTNKHIDQAYSSVDYAVARRDVEWLIARRDSESTFNPRDRPDLWCPISARKLAKVSEHPSSQEHDRRIAEAAVVAGLSRQSREAAHSLGRAHNPSASVTGKVLKFPRPPPTLEALLEGGKEFQRVHQDKNKGDGKRK